MSVCTVDECEKRHLARGMCGMHYQRVTRNGSLIPKFDRGGASPSYAGAHRRCYYLWGSASQYPCVTCGQPANDWAYDHTDPTELTGPWFSNGKRIQVTYSAWPEFYMPLCKSCHATLDKKEETE